MTNSLSRNPPRSRQHNQTTIDPEVPSAQNTQNAQPLQLNRSNESIPTSNFIALPLNQASNCTANMFSLTVHQQPTGRPAQTPSRSEIYTDSLSLSSSPKVNLNQLLVAKGRPKH